MHDVGPPGHRTCRTWLKS